MEQNRTDSKMADCETDVEVFNQFTDRFLFNSVLESLHKGLEEQKQDGRFCDIILKINGRKIAVHSCVLAVFSPWMMAMLSRIRRWPFICDVPEEIDLNLPGSDELFLALKCIVDYMYTGKMKIDHENVDNLQKVSEVLKVPTVTKKCKSWKLRNGHQQQTNAVDNCSGNLVQPELRVENREDVQENNSVDEIIVDFEDPQQQQQQKDEMPVSTKQVLASRSRSLRENTTVKKSSAPTDITSNDSATDIPSSVPGFSTPVESTQMPTEADYMSGGSVVDKDSVSPSGPRRSPRLQRTIKTTNDFTSDGSSEGEDDDDDDVYSSNETTNSYTCSYSSCTFKAITEEELQEHHRKSHLGKYYRCNSCGFSTKMVAMLLAHLEERNHGGTVCSVCNFEASNSEELQVHLKRHKDRKPFWCNTCDARCKTNYALRLHMRAHSSETPFVCEVCSKGFKWKKTLQRHMVVHENKQFLCDDCGFRTSLKTYLDVHRRLHTGETYKCPYPDCNHQTIWKQKLKLHQLTHTKALRRHSETHDSDSNQLKCGLDKLIYQKQTHHSLESSSEVVDQQLDSVPPQNVDAENDTVVTPESASSPSSKDSGKPTTKNPYQCQICGSTFTVAKNLKRHSKIHNAADHLLRCDECPFSTTRMDKLRQHVRKLHSVESTGTVVKRQRRSKRSKTVVQEPLPTPVDVVVIELDGDFIY